MGYQRGHSVAPAPTMSVEHARRRNAELRIELAKLTAEHAHLAPKVETMRQDVTAARKKLTRQIRGLATVRAQTERLAAMTSTMQGAVDETKAPEVEQVPAPHRRPGRALTHGKRSMYESGCDCDDCLAWRRNKTAYEKAREEAKRAAAKGLAA